MNEGLRIIITTAILGAALVSPLRNFQQLAVHLVLQRAVHPVPN